MPREIKVKIKTSELKRPVMRPNAFLSIEALCTCWLTSEAHEGGAPTTLQLAPRKGLPWETH
jgi:hypothetical protein